MRDLAIPVAVTSVLWGVVGLLAAAAYVSSTGFGPFVRRWLVLLLVGGAGTALYLADACYDAAKIFGLDRAQVFWCSIAVLGVAGVVWSSLRQRRAESSGEGFGLFQPSRAECLTLWTVSVLGVAVVVLVSTHGLLWNAQLRGLLAVVVVAWVGGLQAAYFRWRRTQQPRRVWAPTTEGMMLCALTLSALWLAASSCPHDIDPGPHVVWTFAPTERGAIISTPAVDGPRVYVAAIRDSGLAPSGVVYCLDADTGAVHWQFDDDGRMQHMYSSPCLADGRLFVGEGMHANLVCKLYCLEADSGRKLWDFTAAGHIESSPCVAHGAVYFSAGDDGLYCLDAASGNGRWHFHGPFHIDSSPAVVGERLFAGSGVSRRCRETEAFCLEAKTGRVLWRAPTDLPVWGSPRVDNELVFFGLGTGRLERSADPGQEPAGALLCLQAETGNPVWRFRVEEGVFGRPVVDAQHVYFGARDGWCYCLDRRTGELCWKADLGSAIVTNPSLLAGCLVVLSSGGRVCCFDAASGKPLWSFDLAAYSRTTPRVYSSPTVLMLRNGQGIRRRIFFGAELRTPVNNVAALYCLQD